MRGQNNGNVHCALRIEVDHLDFLSAALQADQSI
jgi:hypothetical protein